MNNYNDDEDFDISCNFNCESCDESTRGVDDITREIASGNFQQNNNFEGTDNIYSDNEET